MSGERSSGVRMYIGVPKMAKTGGATFIFWRFGGGRSSERKSGLERRKISEEVTPSERGKSKTQHAYFGRFWYTNIHSYTWGVMEGVKNGIFNCLEVYVCILVYIYRGQPEKFTWAIREEVGGGVC